MSSTLDVFDQPLDLNQIEVYNNNWQSVIMAFQQCVRELKTLGICDESLKIVNLDNHSNIYDLPECDCIMLEGFNSFIDEKKIGFAFFVGATTYNDENNHRLSRIISYLYARFQPGRSILVVDENAKEIGKLITTDGTEVVPMSKEKNRAVQFVSVSTLSTSTVL